MTLSRRLFLGLLASVSAGCEGADSGATPRGDDLPPPTPEALEALRSVLPVPHRARTLGEAYLWELHPRPSPRELWAALEPLPGSTPAHFWARCIADDYSTGRIVSVAGWLLSETEARLAALAAFYCSNPTRRR